jgi:hypothetical protein
VNVVRRSNGQGAASDAVAGAVTRQCPHHSSRKSFREHVHEVVIERDRQVLLPVCLIDVVGEVSVEREKSG